LDPGSSLADFDQAVTLGDKDFNLREQRLEPFQQGTPTGVANAQPNDDGAGFVLAHSVGKVLVFGNDDGLLRESVSPDGRIIGMAHTDISNVLGDVAMLFQESRQCRRQLGIDEEAHVDLVGDEHRVVGLRSGVIKAGLDVGEL
jgi:hypothetical protein